LQQTGITLPCAPERKGPWKRQRKKGAKNKKKRENEKDSDQSTNLSETSTNLKYCLTGESSL
jgi:hypothetical protein